MHQGDFVLKLSEGVRAAEETLGSYVVTPQLAQAFDGALEFIKSALATRQSKAAYLHGSFGSGKSHFMAVLNLLLAGNSRARSLRELAGTVARHNEWTLGRKFLLVPYHMIGARSLESAILGGYADHVRALHPQAPIPGFYLAEGLFRDAQQLRARMGDEAFFGRLNEVAADGGGWGDLAAGWDAASFEAAMLEAPRGDERTRLVGDLIGCYFTAYGSVARGGSGGRDEAFVSLDDGLAILSRHAGELGLRRGDPLPGRTDPVAGEPRRRRGLRQFRGRQALQAGGSGERRPAGTAGQLRRPPAGPARTGGRQHGRRHADAVRRRG